MYQARASEQLEMVRAVRALVLDAEMRCALDEREIEFLWAAPSHIYGQHGWRPNNGSMSERTPYPVGNFKMGVRHGTEGNAKDVLTQRKKWLNSITVGMQRAMQAEAAAAEQGAALAGAPVRLPALEELRHFQKPNPLLGNPASRPGTGNSGILQPAHALLAAHPPTTGGSVGLPATTRAYAGRHAMHHRVDAIGTF